jgi:acyl carrier protein
MADIDIEPIVIATIAETFSVDSTTICRSTIASDIDGWDSLSHTILLMRIEKALQVRIDETLASTAENVGELIDGLRALRVVGKI